MTEQTRTKIIGVILVVAVIWAGFSFKSDSSKPEFAAPQTIQPLQATNNINVGIGNFIDIEKHESLSWGRSPFYLKSLSTISTPQIVAKNNQSLSWILSGIVLNKSSSIAIINRRPVKVGEKINEAVVTRIEKEKVVIKYNRQEITLTVSKG